MKDLLSIVSHFQMQGTVREIKPLGSGLINDTYKVTTVEADAPELKSYAWANRPRLASGT